MNVESPKSAGVTRLRNPHTDLSDLDGLLVNSEKFNQVFIQKINPVWLKRILERISSSPTHLYKLVEILVDMITGGKHPEWIRRAIKWLAQIMNDPSISSSLISCRSSLCRLISFETEMCGVDGLLMSVFEIAQKGEKAIPLPKIKDSTVVVDTGYVFVDDSDEDFGIRSIKRRRTTSETEEVVKDTEDAGSEASMLSDGDDVSSDEADDEMDASADDGVFDVEDETSISDNQQHQSLQYPLVTRRAAQPRPASESDDAGSESNVSSSGDNQESGEEGNAATFSEDELGADEECESNAENNAEESEEEDSENLEEKKQPIKVKNNRKRPLPSSPVPAINIRSLRTRKR